MCLTYGQRTFHRESGRRAIKRRKHREAEGGSVHGTKMTSTDTQTYRQGKKKLQPYCAGRSFLPHFTHTQSVPSMVYTQCVCLPYISMLCLVARSSLRSKRTLAGSISVWRRLPVTPILPLPSTPFLPHPAGPVGVWRQQGPHNAGPGISEDLHTSPTYNWKVTGPTSPSRSLQVSKVHPDIATSEVILTTTNILAVIPQPLLT